MATINKDELASAVLMAGSEGALVRAVDGHGEILWTVGMLPGVHPLVALLPYAAGAVTVSVEGGDVLVRSGRQWVQRSPEHWSSGANPDFTPRRPDDLTLKAEKLVRELQERAASLERRALAAAKALEAKKGAKHAQEGEEAGEGAAAVEAAETGEAAGEAEADAAAS